ncbi:MAG: hypothetical protein ACOYX1_13085 [Acidobacteriota bacterium]
MKGKLLQLLWIALNGLWCAAQTMPYPVGYVYTTSVVDEDNLAITAATVSDTYGESGHTTSAVVKITSPEGRTAYGTGAWAYSSFASTGLSFCDSAGTCYDGLFIARSEGTQEYCPVTSTYLVGQESQVGNEIQPYAYAKSARWVPDAVHYQTGISRFHFTVEKTEGCGGASGGTATVEFSAVGYPTIVKFTVIGDARKAAAFSGSTATQTWELRMDSGNGSEGTVVGTGRLMAAPCRILPAPLQNQKEATLRVQAP